MRAAITDGLDLVDLQQEVRNLRGYEAERVLGVVRSLDQQDRNQRGHLGFAVEKVVQPTWGYSTEPMLRGDKPNSLCCKRQDRNPFRSGRCAEDLSRHLPVAKVRVVAPVDQGGGFGVKAAIYREPMLITYLARKLRRPVRWLDGTFRPLPA